MKDEMEEEEDDSSERESRAHDFVNALMLGPGSEKERAKIDFIQASHRPRVYKAWVRELADTVRDYFWWGCFLTFPPPHELDAHLAASDSS